MGLRLMMDIEPIPEELLIHEVTYEEFLGDTTFGKKWAPPIAITNVRIEPQSNLVATINGESIDVSSMLFIDAVNSSHKTELKKGSRVKFGQDNLTVVECKPYYAFDPNTPHHYEAILK